MSQCFWQTVSVQAAGSSGIPERKRALTAAEIKILNPIKQIPQNPQLRERSLWGVSVYCSPNMFSQNQTENPDWNLNAESKKSDSSSVKGRSHFVVKRLNRHTAGHLWTALNLWQKHVAPWGENREIMKHSGVKLAASRNQPKEPWTLSKI